MKYKFQTNENTGQIMNFTLGVTGNIPTTELISLYYGLGFNFVANYDLEQHIATPNGVLPDLEANDMTGGIYFRAGAKYKLYKSLFFITGIEYSFLPVKLEYYSSNGVRMIERTNLGGLGLQTGLSIDF